MSEDRLVPLSSEREAERSERARRAVRASRTSESGPADEPLGVGALLDRALEILRSDFLRFVLLAGAVLLPERVLQAFFGEHTWGGNPQQFDASRLIGFTLVSLLGVVSFFLAMGFVAIPAYDHVRGSGAPSARSLGGLLLRVPLFACFVGLLSVLVFSGTLLCGVGVFVTAWKFQLALPAYVLEGRSAFASLSRAWRLSRGALVRFSGVFAVTNMISWTWNAAGNVPFSSVSRQFMEDKLGLGGAWFDVVFVPLSCLLTAIPLAYAGIVWVLFYADQRGRVEGVDLERRLREVETRRVEGARESPA